jgi:hypothetical protein
MKHLIIYAPPDVAGLNNLAKLTTEEPSWKYPAFS